MTTFEVEFVFWEKEEDTHSDQASMVAAEPLKYLFWPQIRSRRWQCDRVFISYERVDHIAVYNYMFRPLSVIVRLYNFLL